MNIRRATQEDAELLAALNGPIQQQHADHRSDVFYPAQRDEALIDTYCHWLTEPENIFFIGEVAHVPVAYLFARIIRRPPNPFVRQQQYLVIDQVSVNPDYHKRGYGRLLIAAAFDLAREHGLRRVVLDVWSFNMNAIEFYQHLGFKPYKISMEAVLDLESAKE
jgi:ribosomal protein S18 acetylase RimI-like enzyme